MYLNFCAFFIYTPSFPFLTGNKLIIIIIRSVEIIHSLVQAKFCWLKNKKHNETLDWSRSGPIISTHEYFLTSWGLSKSGPLGSIWKYFIWRLTEVAHFGSKIRNLLCHQLLGRQGIVSIERLRIGWCRSGSRDSNNSPKWMRLLSPLLGRQLF